MDRLYTAFVSSTYRDLVSERKLVSNSLLNASCVPLGMEFFPSTGAGQWTAILDAIVAADFCVFIIGGRYGSIDTATDVSWTRREYREAVNREKPRIALLHGDISAIDPARRESIPKMKAALNDFRAEIESNAICRYFTNHAELLDGLYGSIAALRDNGLIEGWIPAGKRPVLVQESDFDRSYETIETEAVVSRSVSNPLTCDMEQVSRRKMRSNEIAGIRLLPIDFIRDSESFIPFGPHNQPILRLASSIRSRQGSMRLLPPRKTTGSAFVQDIQFDPPLALDETVDVTVHSTLPSYKFAYENDLLNATLSSPMGLRTFEMVSRNILYPTKFLRIRVFLPDELGCTAAGPKVGRTSRIDEAESSRLVSNGSYREWLGEVEGIAGRFTELRVENPRLNWRYRLGWYLPRRHEHLTEAASTPQT